MQLTDDGFLGRKLQILQPKKGGFRAGVDSVFLAACLPAKPGERVLEAGTGPGVAACCLLHRLPDIVFLGLEKEPESVDLARQNLARNHLRGEIIQADVQGPLALAPASFDHAFANPPWFDEKSHTLSPHGLKARAHAGQAETLSDWVQSLAALLRMDASLTMILPAQDQPRAIAAFQAADLHDIVILPILARENMPAIRILIQARKTSRANVKHMPGFVLHGTGNEFRPEAQAILRDGESLQLSA